jgi:hypothetical protein
MAEDAVRYQGCYEKDKTKVIMKQHADLVPDDGGGIWMRNCKTARCHSTLTDVKTW